MDTDGNIRNLSPLLQSITAEVSSPDSGGMVWLVLLFILFVICGAYFGASESGFSAMNKIRIKAKADDGNRSAKSAMFISANFDRALTTLLIGNNITHIAAASIATVIATRLFGTSDTVTLLCTVITTLIVFLFSEMIPKSYANDRSETMALFSAPLLRLLMKLLSPLVSLFTLISSGVTRLTSRFFKTQEKPSITEDELYDIIDTIEEEGVMNEEQGDLFKSALDFSDTRAADVMTVRADIRAVDASLPNDRIISLVRETNHTRLPVYEGDLDHIIGTLQIRIFIREYLKNPNVSLRTLLIAPFRVRPDAMIDDLLSEMREHRFYLAIVAGEDGKTQGLVTIEDFVEELVGDIWDEDDVVDRNFIRLGGNRFRANPRMTLGDACRRMGIPCPDMSRQTATLLSLLPPGNGESTETSFRFHGMELSPEWSDRNRVRDILIRLPYDKEQLLHTDTPEARGTEGGN